MPKNILSSVRHKKRKRAFLRWILFFVVLIFVAVGIFWSLFFIEDLKIKDVAIETSSSKQKEILGYEIDRILSSKFFGVVPKNRIFSFQVEEVKDGLLSKFTNIETLEIERTSLSSILIFAKEREPVAVFCDEDCFFVDKSGLAYERAPIFSSGVLIKFMDKRSSEISKGKFIMNEEDFNKILEFKNKLEDSFSIKEIYLEDNNVCKFYLEEGWYITINIKDDVDYLFNNFSLFWEELSEKNSKDFEYIDLRFGKKVFFKWK